MSRSEARSGLEEFDRVDTEICESINFERFAGTDDTSWNNAVPYESDIEVLSRLGYKIRSPDGKEYAFNPGDVADQWATTRESAPATSGSSSRRGRGSSTGSSLSVPRSCTCARYSRSLAEWSRRDADRSVRYRSRGLDHGDHGGRDAGSRDSNLPQTKRILRTVYDPEENEAWNGLMEMVHRHREMLEEEGYL